MIVYYLLFYSLLLLYSASKLGIGPEEAKILYSSNGLLHFLSTSLLRLASNEVVVRIPTMILSLINLVLFYKLAQSYLRKKDDALLASILFSLLPAVIATSVIINKAPLIIFATLVYLLLRKQQEQYAHPLAILLLFVDKAFAVLFLSVALFYLYYHKKRRALFYFFLFAVSLMIYGFDIGGKPKNYFLDTIAVLSAIFSPLMFLYFFYTIYRILIKEQKDILWFIAGTSFLFALFLSFRQKIHLEDFAPFMVLGVILMVRTFFSSYRVRLEKYRKKLKISFAVVVGVMILNDIVLIDNSLLFATTSPKKHFAYYYYMPKLLAKALQKEGIKCIDANSPTLQLQLQFYGIGFCSTHKLFDKPNGFPVKLVFPYKKESYYYVTLGNGSKRQERKM